MQNCGACERWTKDEKRDRYGMCKLVQELVRHNLGTKCKAFLPRGQECVEMKVAADFWRRPDGSVGYMAEGNTDFDMESAQPDVVIRATVPVPKTVEVEGMAE
jgi:hypothetical protein